MCKRKSKNASVQTKHNFPIQDPSFLQQTNSRLQIHALIIWDWSLWLSFCFDSNLDWSHAGFQWVSYFHLASTLRCNTSICQPPSAAVRNSLAGKMMGSPGKVKDQNLRMGASKTLVCPNMEGTWTNWFWTGTQWWTIRFWMILGAHQFQKNKIKTPKQLWWTGNSAGNHVLKKCRVSNKSVGRNKAMFRWLLQSHINHNMTKNTLKVSKWVVCWVGTLGGMSSCNSRTKPLTKWVEPPSTLPLALVCHI